MAIRNVFACLVHESSECVVDLVRNLRYLDPDSLVLLYNGGTDPALLDHNFPFDRYGAVLHPCPRQLRWGRLHDFALDCMRFALDHHPFDTLTIVDSDQLGVRPGYSAYLERYLSGRPDVGLLGNAPQPQLPTTGAGPAIAAFKEIELWRPLLRRFPDGETKFPYWSFWPSTVFTADAARDLTRLFKSDAQLAQIMQRTRIWASEEVILPTLVALLGYEIASNPCSYSHVKYRVSYTLAQIDAAMTTPDVFWVHPVWRRADDPLRKHIRAKLNHYQKAPRTEEAMVTDATEAGSGLLLTWPILKRMKEIDGWLDEDEADLLIAATSHVLTREAAPPAIVEVGSYCGRSTVVLGCVVKVVRPEARVYAVDPHDGQVGSLDQGMFYGPPTFAAFTRNIAGAGLADVVVPIQSYSFNVTWERPIALLLIDGLHDYANVARDFSHFERWVVEGGYIAFHDYADYFPGVKTFVHELLTSGRYRKVRLVGSMMIVEKLPQQAPVIGDDRNGNGRVEVRVADRLMSDAPAATTGGPLVSCLMLTCNRRPLVPQAIKHFLRQDYPDRELLVVDDGSDTVRDLVPSDPRIRYIGLDAKHTIGAKRNLACEEARGEIVVHWDDDDWMASWRLSYQVAGLLQAHADICGLARLLFYDAAADRAWRYIYPDGSRPWLSGGTLCYTRDFWRRNPFANINVGEDARFVWTDQAKQMLDLSNDTFYVALVHSGNTSPKRTADVWWHAYPAQHVHEIMGDDWQFYARLFGR